MPPIEAIVFDLGGVLIDWNPRYLYRKIFSEEEEMENFLAGVCTSEWNAEQDAGRSFTQAIGAVAKTHPHYETQIEAYFTRWEEMLNGAIEGSVEILKSFSQKNYPLYALTNWSAETFPIAQKNFDFLTLFQGIVVSGEIKMKKPDPCIFHYLIEKHSLIPEKTIFIDDSLPNVETSLVLGFKGIHFQSPEQLQRELDGLGV